VLYTVSKMDMSRHYLHTQHTGYSYNYSFLLGDVQVIMGTYLCGYVTLAGKIT